MKAPRTLLLLAAIVAAAPVCALAQNAPSGNRYKWHDANGALHFSDTLPPEALQQGYDVVDPQGMVVKHVDRPRTAEERRVEAAAAAAREDARKRADDLATADRLLLATYTTEGDLEAVHRDRLEALDKALAAVRISLADQEKGLADQLAHAETFQRDNKPVPAPVKAQIESLRQTIEGQRSFIANREKERVDLIQRSDAEMAHYRELRAKRAAAAAGQ